MTNKEEIFDLINNHPEGLDDDDIAEMTGIQPRQQVQQLCNQLADSKRIMRQSVGKAGKRRKIHNFPSNADSEPPGATPSTEAQPENWRRRLAALIAATGRSEADLLEESLQLLAMKVLREDSSRS
jgi:hypothetical protein